MKKTLIGLSAMLMLAGMTGVASATITNPCAPGVPCTWEDQVNFSSTVNGQTVNYVRFNDRYDTATALFDIAPPFVPGIDTLTNVQFFLEISDSNNGSEKVKVFAGSWDYSTGDIDDEYNWDWSSSVLTNTSILTDLSADGILSFKIDWKEGDFRLESAGIAARGCDNPNNVPEPATMLLLGTGLVGLVGARRKKA